MSVAMPALADTIDWATWSDATIGSPNGSALATFATPGLTAQYFGGVQSVQPSTWLSPASSFSGGPVDNAPTTGGLISLDGGSGTGTNTVTFSQAIVNPVMAIVSLGNSGVPSEYTFNAPVTIVAGGPSPFGGGSITSSGNSVFGVESSGTVEFIGTYTSISWTAPNPDEAFFTFGASAVAAVPEPETYALMLAGLGALGMFVRRRNQG